MAGGKAEDQRDRAASVAFDPSDQTATSFETLLGHGPSGVSFIYGVPHLRYQLMWSGILDVGWRTFESGLSVTRFARPMMLFAEEPAIAVVAPVGAEVQDLRKQSLDQILLV